MGKLAGHVRQHRGRRQRRPPGRGAEFRIEGDGVGDGFEGRAGLAQGHRPIHGPGNGGIEIIGAADEEEDAAMFGMQRHQRPIVGPALQGPVAARALEFGQAAAHAGLCLLLQGQIEGGFDGDPAPRQALLAQRRLQLAVDEENEVGGGDGEGRGRVVQGLASGPRRLFLGDDACLHHQGQHLRLAVAGGRGVFNRIVQGRGLRQADQQCALRQIEIAGAAAKIGLGRGLDAGGEVAVIHLIQIQRQQVIFLKPALQPPGQQRLAQLAAQALLVALLLVEQQQAGDLLADGGAALDHPPPRQLAQAERAMAIRSTPGCW